jgi:hypothetical protein
MKTEVLWISFVALSVGVTVLVIVFYKMKLLGDDFNPTGLWFNESLNIRILLHDIDSVFQGSVVWANGIDKFLGMRIVENVRFDKRNIGKMRIVENVRFDKRNIGKGLYSDPLTGNQFEIQLNVNRKGMIYIQAFHPNTSNPAFSQEWKQVDN